MRGSKKAGPVKRRVMRGGGMAKKSGPVKKRGGGMAKKAGPVKKKMRGGGSISKKSGPAKKKMRGGGMTKKGGPVKMKAMRGGGGMRRNLRDEEARVIGRQDDAADELRRVKSRRPKDAAERRDKTAETRRVSSRERDARDEMDRLRRKAVGLGMKSGGKTKKQGYNDKLDESLGARNKTKGKQSLKSRRKESEGMEKASGKRKFSAVGTMDKSSPSKKKSKAKKSSAGKSKTAKSLSPKISQHKRMAMGENVLTGKMIKKASGGKITKTKAPKRAPATTGVKLNMGAPKSKTINARGMGAAIKGGKFRTNT